MTAPRKEAKSKKETYDHPKYVDMVCEAVIQLRKRTGASLPAIKSYLEEKYELPENYNVHLKAAIKKLLEKEQLIKVKASYKLDPEFKKQYMKENHIVLEKKEEEEEEEKPKKKETKKTEKKEEKPKKEKKEKKEAKETKEKKEPRVAKAPAKKKNLKESSKVEGPRTADRSKKQAASARVSRAKNRDKVRDE